ncbi:acyltransferase [Scandinavium sp.]|uniref:acyltransferase family protein n=1 Tax=Scandinavium sp. TaxID=2830653 RepID=UPI00289A67EE|nr:acyltransferase [Scandinavium sp.]
MQGHKISYLEGLRGISCMVVIFDHCVNDFYPALRHTGDPGVAGAIKTIIAASPLNIIYSGLISVFIFFVLSGYVLSYKYHKTKELSVVTIGALKRYFRLLIPVIASMIFFWLCFESISLIFGDRNPFSLNTIIKTSVYNVFFTGKDVINGPLWTMHIELMGSFVVFALIALTHNLSKRWLIYTACLAYSFNTVYFLFIFGAFVCDIVTSGYLKDKFTCTNKYMLAFLFVTSLIFMSYPTIRPGVSTIGMHSIMKIDTNFNIASFWHILGVCLFFYFSMNSKITQDIFSRKTPLFLGKISFSSYVIHFPILLLVKRFGLDFGNGSLTLLLNSFLVYFFSIIVSIAFEKYIDRNAVHISNKLVAAFK